jgi:hypothetical protein
MFALDSSGLDPVAHIIQVALTPIFLLSGIATLLSVFSTRLARVADLVDATTKAFAGADAEEGRILSERLAHLRRRSIALDVAVVLGAIGGAATCGAVLTLFVGALRDTATVSVLFLLFGLAVVCALGAIGAFTLELLMSGVGIRARVAASQRDEAEAVEATADSGTADQPTPTSNG